jgi:uncharacterized membrane protein YccC
MTEQDVTTVSQKMAQQIERAEQELEAARNRLYLAVGERKDSQYLAAAVNAVAEVEGKLQVLGYAQRASSNGKSPEEMVASLLDNVLMGADDGWSGRTNDAKRAHFDGKREGVRWIVRRLGVDL